MRAHKGNVVARRLAGCYSSACWNFQPDVPWVHGSRRPWELYGRDGSQNLQDQKIRDLCRVQILMQRI